MSAPTGYIALGVVGYSPKGAYDAAATYNKYNTVYYQGSTFYAKQDNITGITPVEGASWGLLAAGAAYVIRDLTADNPVADTSVSGYTWSQTFSWSGMTASATLYLSIISGSFDGIVAASGTTDSVTVYFDSEPSGSVGVRIQAFIG